VRSLRAVQVSFHADPGRRRGDALLEAWPTLPDVALAASGTGVELAAVQAAHADEVIARGDVDFHFVADDSASRYLVARQVIALSPDVVHVQGFGHPLAIRHLVLALGRVPVLVQDHGGVVPPAWRAAAWRWGHRGIRGAAFTSREQAAPWRDARVLGASVPVFEVLESSTHFSPGDRAAARHSLGMSGDPCFLWTGHLDANKDPLALLDALDVVLGELPSARLYCCFVNAPLRGDVERRLAWSPRLADAVTLLGARPHAEVEQRFRAADFFVQMSHREGSGYSVIEALACGCTPLVTETPALCAIVGDAGALVPVGDSAAMARAMLAFAARERGALRAQARRRFEAALTFEHVGQQLRRAYGELAGVWREAGAPARASVVTA